MLPDVYWLRALMLAKAMRILLGDIMLPEDLQLAEGLLEQFYRLYEMYYGEYYEFVLCMVLVMYNV